MLLLRFHKALVGGGAFAWWLSQDLDYSPDEIAAILNRLIIAPLVGDLGRAPAASADAS